MELKTLHCADSIIHNVTFTDSVIEAKITIAKHVVEVNGTHNTDVLVSNETEFVLTRTQFGTGDRSR